MMTIKEYLAPLAEKDKKSCRMFVRFLIERDVYVEFGNNLCLRCPDGWLHFYYNRPLSEWEFYLIFDAFSWCESIWGELNDEWMDIVIEYYKSQ